MGSGKNLVKKKLTPNKCRRKFRAIYMKRLANEIARANGDELPTGPTTSEIQTDASVDSDYSCSDEHWPALEAGVCSRTPTECLLHRSSSPMSGEIFPFSGKTLVQVQKCSEFWKTSCFTMDVAIAKRFQEALEWGMGRQGYHEHCYVQFTDEDRIQNAQDTAFRVADMGPVHAPANAFPYVCIFCFNPSKRALKRCSSTEQAAKILAAAAERKDQRLLDLIVGEDIIAKRLVFHPKCYTPYTYVSPRAPEVKLPDAVEAGFRDFVINEIPTVEVKGRICVSVAALGDLFVKTVADVRAYGGYDDKVGYLIACLRKYCPYRLSADGMFGVKPLPVVHINRRRENLLEDNGEAVDVRHSWTVVDYANGQETCHATATKDDEKGKNNQEMYASEGHDNHQNADSESKSHENS